MLPCVTNGLPGGFDFPVNVSTCVANLDSDRTQLSPAWTSCCDYAGSAYFLNPCYQACPVSNSTAPLDLPSRQDLVQSLLRCITAYEVAHNQSNNTNIRIDGVECVNSPSASAGFYLSPPATMMQTTSLLMFFLFAVQALH